MYGGKCVSVPEFLLRANLPWISVLFSQEGGSRLTQWKPEISAGHMSYFTWVEKRFSFTFRNIFHIKQSISRLRRFKLEGKTLFSC